jgi:DNA recombination protein RmuC
VRDEARRLVTALTSSPKQRGRWGEQSLRNVLVQAGLVEGVDFQMEVSVNSDEGRLRPDAVVNLPQGRKLIIDAKCSLNAYLDACDEVDDDKRTACFKAHLASIVRHAQQLGSKNYWAQFGDAADYVIMYIPGEHFLTAALEQDSELWEKAFKDKVLLATPTNLVAIARTVASVWKQEKLAAEAARLPSSAASFIRVSRPWRSTSSRSAAISAARLMPTIRWSEASKAGHDSGAPLRGPWRRQRQGDRTAADDRG